MHNTPTELRFIFPASRFEAENFALGVQKFCDLGFSIPSIPKVPEPHRFYCANRTHRFASLKQAVETPGPAILVAARGGYGCAELLSLCEAAKWNWSGKTVLGFSDLTALHAFLSNNNIPSFHGPMAASTDWLKASDEESLSLCATLAGSPPALTVTESLWAQQDLKVQQDVAMGPLEISQEAPAQNHFHQGRLVGGNLTVLASLMGTPWQLQLRHGDILFLEDIGEPEYRLARCLFQLSHCTHFSSCHIIWGHLTNCGPLASENPKQLIGQLMENLPNSWSYGLKAGHERPNMTLPLGTHALLRNHQLSFRNKSFLFP